MTTHSRTTNGAVQYSSSFDYAVDFFSKAGSAFSDSGATSKKGKSRRTFVSGSQSALELFKAVWYSGQKEIAMKLLFWLRDVRGGAGNRSGFIDCIKWLAQEDTAWIEANIGLIPEHGRFKDLVALFNTSLNDKAAQIWGDALIDNNMLAFKWAKREYRPLHKYLRSKGIVGDIGEFRRFLSARKEHIVESKMCAKEWDGIEFQKVPSLAMSRYAKAFTKNAGSTFTLFKKKVENGEANIHAGVLFPHDCVRMVDHGDAETANLQFNALPNYFEDAKEAMRVLAVCDTSGSMSIPVAGGTTAMDVSKALGLYCSNQLPMESPFYRKFLQFSSESNLYDWKCMKFSEALRLFDHRVGSTNLTLALDTILAYAQKYNATNDQIPNTLLIISDMQFDDPCATQNSGKTVAEAAMTRWEKAGYTKPKIVYWNISPHAGSPSNAGAEHVAMVSGFSPSVMKALFSGEEVKEAEPETPRDVMMRAIEKYTITIPSRK